jgi:murein DD-endopeptidase MepM/ murein hydrolase activator NlpD
MGMFVKRSFIKWFVWMSILFIGAAVQSYAASSLSVEVHPEKIFPGQAVLLQIKADREIAVLSATLGDQKILFFSDCDQKGWMGLAGLDLNVSPDDYTLSYKIRFADGQKIEGTHVLTVLKKEFPEERITVDDKYVHLSQKDIERFVKEKKILGSIYGVQSPDRPWEKGFDIPVNVQKGSRFGLKRIINGEPRSPHSGADLKAGSGTPVGASNAGKVVFSGDLFFSGNTVILDHGGGLYTIYAHLSDMTAGKGDAVEKGEVIGHVGATGRVTGPHLHWGVKLNGARVDPFSLISLPISDEE